RKGEAAALPWHRGAPTHFGDLRDSKSLAHSSHAFAISNSFSLCSALAFAANFRHSSAYSLNFAGFCMARTPLNRLMDLSKFQLGADRQSSRRYLCAKLEPRSPAQ